MIARRRHDAAAILPGCKAWLMDVAEAKASPRPAEPELTF